MDFGVLLFEEHLHDGKPLVLPRVDTFRPGCVREARDAVAMAAAVYAQARAVAEGRAPILGLSARSH